MELNVEISRIERYKLSDLRYHVIAVQPSRIRVLWPPTVGLFDCSLLENDRLGELMHGKIISVVLEGKTDALLLDLVVLCVDLVIRKA